MKHSKLSPSGIKTWANCPGSVQLIEALDLPPEDMSYKPAALEGTIAHYIVEKCLLEDLSTDQFILRNIKTPEGYSYYANSDLIEAVNVYLSYIRGLKAKDFRVEQFYSLTSLGVPGLDGGTCDFIAYDKVNKTLEIVDFKNGVADVVSPVWNGQLMQYATGFFLEELPELTEFELEAWRIRLTIVQPRGLQEEKIAQWDLSYSDLWKWVSEYLIVSAEATRAPDAQLNPSPEACRWCRAKTSCPAYQELIVLLLDN